MFCGFIRTHCYKVVITALAVLVFFEYGFGVFYEENRRINEAYFTFNLTAPRLSATGTYNDSDINYSATANMTLIALQSSNSSDPYQLDLLADSLNFTRKPLMCPLVSPLLVSSRQGTFSNDNVVCFLFQVGRMNVSKIAMPMKTFQEKYGPLLGPGGRYHPPNCQAHYKVAIIIPYRKREEHLQVFIQHMHPFLQRQQIDYGIFVVEQSGETPFNRAMLMNIGAAEALRQDGFQCFVFHDVDLLPEDDRNTYSCPEQPRHMSVAIDVFKYRLPYEGLFGGVSAMTTEHFIKVNGFSNLFWGWGGEDDDMSSRIKYHKLIISRYPPSTARYTMLSHKKARPNPNRYRVMRNGAKRSKVDGLSNLKYKRLDLQMNPLYIHILVDIKPS